MFERFSSDARAVVVGADQHARVLGDDHVRPQHLVLGILDQSVSVAVRTLSEIGVDLDAARHELATRVGPSDVGSSTPRSFTPDAKRTLELSLREALEASDNRIQPEHLLLAVLREPESPTAQILARHGGDPDRVRAALLQALEVSNANPRDPAVRRIIRRWRSGGPPPELEIVTALQNQLDRLEREVTRLAAILDRFTRDADPE